MAKTLVLAEKPSVGKELARVLGCRRGGEGCLEGERYIVTWALGHLVELAPPEAYDKAWEKWDLLTLPMLPEHMKTAVIKETGRQFRAVQALMRRGDVQELVIATDAGREGELVARWIMEKAGWNKPAKRLWISSQTDKAIRDGFSHLRPAGEYDDLFHSARARSEADWLVGLNVTRALTCKHGAQLSAGRVQTPTLALIVDREEEIRRFVPQEYFTVQAKCRGFTATWRDRNGQTRTFDRERAEHLCAALQGKHGVLSEVKRTLRQAPPPAAYDLTELQRDANRKYAYSAKETLSLMQSLYERHKLLTYPRTDSRYISDDVVSTLPERLKSVMVDEYRDLARAILMKRPLQTRFLVDNARVTDHHAILPTEEQPELFRLSGPERNIYDLVVRRFLAVLLPPCEYEETRLTLTVGGETFTARGKIMKEPGWRAAYVLFLLEEDEEEEGEEREQSLPPLRQGDSVEVLSARVSTGKTAPPKRYTEATLLTAMERPPTQGMDRAQGKILEETGGLGTPATRADIIEKLFSAFYLYRAPGQGAGPHLQGASGGGAGAGGPPLRPAHRPVGEAAGGHRAGPGAGERLCKRNAWVCIPAGGRGEDKRRRLPPRQRNPGEVPGLRQVPSGRPGQAGKDAGVSGPGVRLPAECHPDHQCPLPQLPQKDGASERRGKAALRLCVRLSGTALRL